jgi:hypothetical protein
MGPGDEGLACGRRAALLSLTVLLLAGCGGAASLDRDAVVPRTVEVGDPLLAERMVSLAERSSTWRAALDSLRENGLAVLVGTPSDIRARIPSLSEYQPDHVGEVVPIRNGEGEIVAAVVAIDLPRLERLYRGSDLPLSAFHADIDRVLIHEIYGHVVPLAASRTIEGGCPDPRPGEPATSSCAIERENRIRRELGMEKRTTYDILGLVIGRYYYGRPMPVR